MAKPIVRPRRQAADQGGCAMTHRLDDPSRVTAKALTFTASVIAMLLLAAPAGAQVQTIGAEPEAKNMRLVGFNDLQARSAHQPTIARQGSRYFLYVGHHGGSADAQQPLNPLTGKGEFNGTSVLDITDPKAPKYLKH